MSHGEDSREARTLTDDSKGEGYTCIYERRSSRIVARLKTLKKYKRDYRSRRALHVSHSTGQDRVQAQYRIICHVTL